MSRQKLLEKKKISAYDFNRSIDLLQFTKGLVTDSLHEYSSWLLQNEKSLLSNKNPFFKIDVFLELAAAKFAYNQHEEALSYIDSIFTYLPPYTFFDAFVKINKYGAFIASDKADFEKVIHYNENILNSEKIRTDTALLSEVYLNIANNYLSSDQYDKSMYYCYKAYPLLQATNNQPGMIDLLLNMFNSSQFSSNDSTSLDYLYKAIEMARNYGDSVLISDTYFNLGKAFYRKSNLAEAIKYYKTARNYSNDKGSKREVRIAVYQHLAYTYNPDSVEKACEMSDYILTRSLINNDIKLLGNAYLSRANCFANHGERDSTVYYLDRAEEYRNLYGNPNSSAGFFNKMHEVSMKIKDYERSLRYLDIANGENIRIHKETNANQLNETRAQLDYLLQKEQIKELNFDNQLQKEKNLRQKIIMISLILFIFLGFAFIVFARKKYRQIKFSYKELVRKNIELDKLNKRLSQAENKLQSKKNGLIIKDEEKIYKKLKLLFEKEKIYKESDLGLATLADRLNTNTSYLSSIINNRTGESFKTFLNKYRIDEARRILVSAEFTNYSIEGIAKEVGFQSRSTFYQAFRQITGLTPTDYTENYFLNDDIRIN